MKKLIDQMKETDQTMSQNIGKRVFIVFMRIADISLRGEKLEILVNTTKQTKSEATGLDRRVILGKGF
jgi:hypothetical protein